MKRTSRMFKALLWGIILLVFALVGQAGAQTWTQLNPTPDPTYGFPSLRVWNTMVYNTANKRLIVFGGGGSGGYGILNDAWVLTDADGADGTPAWIRLNPSGGLPGAREAHVAVYDQANNRMIIHGGYTRPGYCEGVIGDVWVLSNADGTGGTPTWTQLSPTGTAPSRRFHGAAYDSENNRLIINGGAPAGCGPGVNDTWVLTNANGLGGTPAWIRLSPTVPSNFPGDTSTGNTGYDSATNTLIRILYRDGFVSTWLLSNANGLGGPPAWSEIAVRPEPVAPTWFVGGSVYDQGTNTFTYFGAGDPPSNETWTLTNANDADTAEWIQLNPTGSLPDTRVWSFAGYFSETNRLTIYGGSKDSWNGTNEVWVLTDANGSTHQLPVANAGPDQAVLDEVTLDGSQSYDPDGEIASYEWYLQHRDNSDYDRIAEGENPTVSGLEPGFYDVTLTVTDDEGSTGIDTMLLAVADSGYIDELEALLLQKDQTIGDLSLQIAQNEQTIADLNAQIAALNAQVAALSAQVAQNEQTIADLNEQIGALTAQVSALNAQVAQNEQTIADLNAQIGALTAQVSALNAQVAQNEQTIADLNAQIASMYTQEQLVQAIADACPGNSENRGRPESPGKSDPPGQKKK